MVYHWSLKQSVDQVDRIILFLVDDFGVHLCHFTSAWPSSLDVVYKSAPSVSIIVANVCRAVWNRI